VQLPDALQAIRPGRESATGWTPEAARHPQNHSSLVLNERGSALNVFWSRQWRDGRRAGARTRLPKAGRVGNRLLAQENRAGGSGARSNLVGSFRFEIWVGSISPKALEPDG
jgi:hypothetical protein